MNKRIGKLRGDQLESRLEKEKGETMVTYLEREHVLEGKTIGKISKQLMVRDSVVERILLKYDIPIKKSKTDLYASEEARIEKAKEIKEKHRKKTLPGRYKLEKMGYGGLAAAISKKEKSWYDFRLKIGEKEKDIRSEYTITEEEWAKRFEEAEKIIEDGTISTIRNNIIENKVLLSLFQGPFFNKNGDLFRDIFGLPKTPTEKNQYIFEKNQVTDSNLDYRAKRGQIYQKRIEQIEMQELIEEVSRNLTPRQTEIVKVLIEVGGSTSKARKELGISRQAIFSMRNILAEKIRENYSIPCLEYKEERQ